jgi:hypothetical protein
MYWMHDYDTGNYQAAASGCPEVLTVSLNLLNGTYHIYHDFVGQS